MMGTARRAHPPSSRSPGLAALLLACACGSGPPPTEEFLLGEVAIVEAASHAGLGSPRAGPPLPPLRVRPLLPRGFLDRDPIAWREGDVRAGAYHYRRWGEPPAEAATRLLVAALRARGAFEQVDGAAARPTGPLTLSGELLGLHEATDEDGGRPRGVAEIEVVLEASGDAPADGAVRRILHARREVAARDDSMEALVRAVSEALAGVLEELAPQIVEQAAAIAPPR